MTRLTDDELRALVDGATQEPVAWRYRNADPMSAWMPPVFDRRSPYGRIGMDEQPLYANDVAPSLAAEVLELRAEVARLREERDAALTAVVKIAEKMQRECFGMNNEGDPIGGDPPIGWKPRAEAAERKVEELLSIAAEVEISIPPKAYRVRVKSDDTEEWSLIHPEVAVDYLDRVGFECQPLYISHNPERCDLQAALTAERENADRLAALLSHEIETDADFRTEWDIAASEAISRHEGLRE